MKEITPKDSRYVPLSQQKWCRVPACFQMVMLRHGVPLVPAELLGYHLGLIVPKSEAKNFWNARTGPKPGGGYGTQYGKPAYRPNRVFEKLGIPLRVKETTIDTISSAEDLAGRLSDIVAEDCDALICFDWGTLMNRKYHGGHVCVLDRVLPDGKSVRIIDPERGSKWKIVKVSKLYRAMQYHGKAFKAGIWEVEKVD